VSRQDQHELQDSFYKNFGLLNEKLTFLAGLGSTKSKCKSSQLCQMELYEAMHKDAEDGLLSVIHPLAFAAKANNDDTPNYYQAMNGLDAEGYYKAMGDEMESLEKLDPWEIVPESDGPLGANVLDSTWAFKCKRYPDGSVQKLKARWCIRGDQQIEGVDFFDTFAPVVAWLMVCLLLILILVLGLATKQVDYTNAFCQADLDDEVYVQMPKLFEKPGHVY
jgi:Reverse transcriptase (RNA-dependent DNA polymerase)